MSEAYYGPEDGPDRIKEDITSLLRGDAPEWWDRGFEALVESGRVTRSWFDFAQGYEFAAQNLAELMSAHSSDSFRIQLTPPIVFLYRHAVELMVKQAFTSLEAMEGREVEAPGSHDFLGLWTSSVRDRLRDGFIDPDLELDILDSAMATINELDPSSFTFRYPADRKGIPTANMPRIDPGALGRVVTHVVDALSLAVARVVETRDGREWREA